MPLDPYDYVRIQAQLDFQCVRCGICCQVADPIDIYPKDIRRLSSYFNISIEETVKEYTIPHPTEPDLRAFKASATMQILRRGPEGMQDIPGQTDGMQVQPFSKPWSNRTHRCRGLRRLPCL